MNADPLTIIGALMLVLILVAAIIAVRRQREHQDPYATMLSEVQRDDPPSVSMFADDESPRLLPPPPRVSVMPKRVSMPAPATLAIPEVRLVPFPGTPREQLEALIDERRAMGRCLSCNAPATSSTPLVVGRRTLLQRLGGKPASPHAPLEIVESAVKEFCELHAPLARSIAAECVQSDEREQARTNSDRAARIAEWQRHGLYERLDEYRRKIANGEST